MISQERADLCNAYAKRPPCPFCGSRDGCTFRYGNVREPWTFECICGARGPWAPTEREAIEKWSGRVEA